MPFRQQQIDLPKIEVPIGFPLYSMRNGRTHRAQAAYIEEHGLPADFFSDPEDESAQDAQGVILRNMIDQADLREDLEDTEQKVPAVLTFDGLIVNGNRRTAALRADGTVEQLVAVVLPEDARSSDLYETELDLQMARDTKAEYNWIDEALHVRWGIRELAEAPTAIARRMRISEQGVNEILGRLSLVDLYLDWLDSPGKYHKVPADERSATQQSFTDLYQRERRQRFRALPELQQRAVRTACFAVIKQGGGYIDVRRVADGLINHPHDVVAGLRGELPEELSTRLDEPIIDVPATASPSPAGSLFDELGGLEEQTPAPEGAQLLNLLHDATFDTRVADSLSAVAEDLDQRAREAREQGQPLRKVERALRNLRDVSVNHGTQRLDDIASTLADVLARADELIRQIEDMRRP